VSDAPERPPARVVWYEDGAWRSCSVDEAVSMQRERGDAVGYDADALEAFLLDHEDARVEWEES
jgi:hypothetical protein